MENIHLDEGDIRQKFYTKRWKMYLIYSFFKKKGKTNQHNFTFAKNIFLVNKILVRKKIYGNDDEKLIIGLYCSIAGDVKFLLGGDHSYLKSYCNVWSKRR